MKHLYIICGTVILSIILIIGGNDLMRKREYNRQMALLSFAVDAEERITKTRELRVVVDAKLDAIQRGGMKELLKVSKQLEEMESKK